MSREREVSTGESQCSEIARVDIGSLNSRDFYYTFRTKGVPLVITGAMKGVEDWTLPFLREKFAGEVFPARHYGPDRFGIPKTKWKTYAELKTLPFEEYADMLADGTARRESIYMAQVDIGSTRAAKAFRNVLERLSQCTDLGQARFGDLNLWLGPSGHTEPLHFDLFEGTLMQLHGSKRIVLFPPSQTTNLYPFPLFSDSLPPWFSQIYVDKPDFAAYPKLRTALKTQLEITLNKGEVLYIPSYWWHEVSALGTDYVCSLNHFWKVKPWGRNFVTKRSTLIYLLARLPTKPMMFFYRGIVRLRRMFGGQANKSDLSSA